MVSLGVDRDGVMRAADNGAAMVDWVFERLIIECIFETGVEDEGVRGARRGERRRGKVDGCCNIFVLPLLQDGVPDNVVPLLYSISTVEFTHLSASAFCLNVFCNKATDKFDQAPYLKHERSYKV